VLGVVEDFDEVAVLAAGAELGLVEAFVDLHAVENPGESFLLLGLVFLVGMLLPVATEGIELSKELVLDALDVALAQADASIATHFVPEEADVAVAVLLVVVPKERVV